MANYDLLPNEAVLIKDESVFRGGGSSIELILTNLNLIMVSESIGFLKRRTETETIPVNQIKVHNGQAQALMTRSGNRDVLEVYFLHSQEQFRFSNGGKRTIQTWIGKINEAVTGQPAAEVELHGIDLVADAISSVRGGDRVAGVLKDTFGAINFKRGAKPEAVVQIATKCISCGAAVSGVQGQTVSCSYCLSAQQL